MKQATQRVAERRTVEQQAGSFTFWFRRPQATKQVGAWMLAQSASEAAFLTAARDAPRIGEQLELTDLGTTSLTIPQAPPQHSPHLPKFGRVVRLDKPQGVTRRVAIQFEDQPRSRLVRTGEDQTAPSQL
jgi:hypothetical protein